MFSATGIETYRIHWMILAYSYVQLWSIMPWAYDDLQALVLSKTKRADWGECTGVRGVWRLCASMQAGHMVSLALMNLDTMENACQTVYKSILQFWTPLLLPLFSSVFAWAGWLFEKCRGALWLHEVLFPRHEWIEPGAQLPMFWGMVISEFPPREAARRWIFPDPSRLRRKSTQGIGWSWCVTLAWLKLQDTSVGEKLESLELCQHQAFLRNDFRMLDVGGLVA